MRAVSARHWKPTRRLRIEVRSSGTLPWHGRPAGPAKDEKAEILWTRFFEELASASADTQDLGLDEPAMSIHAYIFSKLARSEQPTLFPVMMRYRSELVAYMQRYLEHASDERQLEVMRSMVTWVTQNLPDQ